MDFLGERLASTAVGEVTVQQLPDDAPNGLLPLSDIHAEIVRSINKG